jgi:hypothetical protein
MKLLTVICVYVLFVSFCTMATGQAQQTGIGAKGESQALQQQMMSDPEIMNMIQSLQNDPDFQQILQDPEIMKAVNSGDIAALMANQKFMRLLDNKTVHDIGTKLQK